MYIKTHNKEIGAKLAAYYQAGKPIEIMGKSFLGTSIGFEYPDSCVEFHGSEVSKVAWSGEGLPPVGTVCEFYADEDTWRECKIVGENEGYLIVWVTHAHIWTTKAAALLRPIRTPEQIAAEKREADIEELRVLLSNVACDDYQAAVAMIDAGYHK